MPGREHIDELKHDYHMRQQQIVKRLEEFKEVYARGDRAIFEELCYCILTAGSSAAMGMRAIEALKDLLFEGSERELRARARKHHLRFWRLRPAYIVHTREYLRSHCDLKLQKLIASFPSGHERRAFFAENGGIKGLGYKESSHFLRNLGFSGYAILDIHILKSLREMGVIDEHVRTNTRTGYLAVEQKLKRFAAKIGIDMDQLDLLLWSRKTGCILK